MKRLAYDKSKSVFGRELRGEKAPTEISSYEEMVGKGKSAYDAQKAKMRTEKKTEKLEDRGKRKVNKAIKRYEKKGKI